MRCVQSDPHQASHSISSNLRCVGRGTRETGKSHRNRQHPTDEIQPNARQLSALSAQSVKITRQHSHPPHTTPTPIVEPVIHIVMLTGIASVVSAKCKDPCRCWCIFWRDDSVGPNVVDYCKQSSSGTTCLQIMVPQHWLYHLLRGQTSWYILSRLVKTSTSVQPDILSDTHSMYLPHSHLFCLLVHVADPLRLPVITHLHLVNVDCLLAHSAV